MDYITIPPFIKFQIIDNSRLLKLCVVRADPDCIRLHSDLGLMVFKR